MLNGQVLSPIGRRVVRSSHRRLTTAAPTPKKRHPIRKFLYYSAGATATFYIGSTFLAFKNHTYHEFFTQKVPGGTSAVQYAEDHNWDTITPGDVIDSAKSAKDTVQQFIYDQTGWGSPPEKPSQAAKNTAQTMNKAVSQSKDRIVKAADKLKTSVKKSENAVSAVERHQQVQFSNEVQALVEEVEAALAGKPRKEKAKTTDPTPAPTPGVTTSPEQPELALPTHPQSPADAPKNVYDAPLPLGFEPPPGFNRPRPPAPKVEAPPAPPPLPLIAPEISDLTASEPILGQLATTIDNLTVFLNSNPAAAEKAHGVIDTAKLDLTNLATRMHKMKEDEQAKLEQQLDDQAREYTVKLLELEMAAQDKLDNQEDEFRKLFDEEKAKLVRAYREKLSQELQTQSEIINERLKEEVIAQGIELQRRWIREIKVRIEQERGGRLAKLEELAGNLKKLERVTLNNSAYLDQNIGIHALWSAIRALTHNTVEAHERRPFRDELRILRHLSIAKDDPVIATALETLDSSTIPDTGVEPFADLSTWFTTAVAPKVASVALVPDQDAGLLSYLASGFLSSFRFKRTGLVEGDDILSVLARAEHHLNEKDLNSAARELNQLKGAAKVLLQDWLKAARERLEVQQALDVVQTQATFASLLVV